MEYLTQEKKASLEAELNNLKSVRRREIADALEYAKSLGDLSENAEYNQAREDQANCEDRIIHVETILKNAVVLDKHAAKGIVEVGTTVSVIKKGSKDEQTFTIVGSEEADSMNGKISNESPLGRAIIGRKAGDTVEFVTPKGDTTYTIKSVE